ncbi:M23 family metallopeptidase [Pseudoclavibacter sp. VKM Ac-2867]|uniref:M23 family metallopeptidase n=1 Tax=Pseudoclavibacter sp. VKM Ac-2867 TaxID=2783829 RepID=UPI00188D6E8A|nr:M23 family metallopeptidase [Pseudoclavibacter sp. VKM Ac-2867]MBF4459500.1 peptidoglycan DD-metalloendopeptidase family protein [Pseudoclavibacter sp. VKM Ac-2867]
MTTLTPTPPDAVPFGRRTRRAHERRSKRQKVASVAVAAASVALILGATFGGAGVRAAAGDDGQSSVPIVTSSDAADGRGGVTYTVSGDLPAAASSREVPLTGAAAAAAAAGVQWPADMSKVTVTDGFGPHVSPCSGCSSNHRGLDLAGPEGTRLGSIAAGAVVDVVRTDTGGLGAHVVVEHRIDGKQVRSVYGHMVAGSPAVSIGDQVKPGQLVGLLGNTGASTGAHLHLEIIVDGVHVDPQKFLQKYADGKAVDVFGEAPAWNPPSDNSADEGEGWTPEQSDSYVPPAVPVIETPAPTVPAAPDAGPSPQQPAPENPRPVDPAPSTPDPSQSAPSGDAPAPSDATTPRPSAPKEPTAPEPQEAS